MPLGVGAPLGVPVPDSVDAPLGDCDPDSDGLCVLVSLPVGSWLGLGVTLPVSLCEGDPLVDCEAEADTDGDALALGLADALGVPEPEPLPEALGEPDALGV